MANNLFWPAVAMALLTCFVWVRIFIVRIPEMRRRRIHPQAVAQSAQRDAIFEDTRASDNFKNLFELPVLFYLALFVAHASGQVGSLVVALAWIFVLLRWIHSLIQCTYNRVMHRFQVYLLGGVVLWLLWAVIAFGLWR
ncbi:MAG TPA: MAPEG family protein [Arenimonas sp.]|uniref:MAPEG family protein n=1 Tax=Arenimonas sp. TaxID=1872635 RepID=UPI002C059B32|nr:MAPEG family protein [Arenimonas sp.]HMB57322.1 MAPEG family protein [Arenimonas sp.]